MEWLLAAVGAWGWAVYLVGFALVFAQSAGLPLPALTFVSLAAGLAGTSQGDVSFWPIYGATLLGGALGGLAGHALGAQGGRPLLGRYGRRLRITSQRLEKSEQFFNKHGYKAMLVARYLPVLCFAGSVLSGIHLMERGRFALANTAGITLWATTQLLLAYYFGFAVGGLF